MKNPLSNDKIDQIVALDKDYAERKAAINDGENARNNAIESRFDLSNREGRTAFLRVRGDETRRLHADNTAWYRAARQAITGLTWEQEMAQHE